MFMPGEISELFPNLFGQQLVSLLPQESNESLEFGQPLTVGVVLSGGQAPGGHNVIAGIFGPFVIILCNSLKQLRATTFCTVVSSDSLQKFAPGSVLLGFKGGIAGIMSKNAVKITQDFLFPYRNQVWP